MLVIGGGIGGLAAALDALGVGETARQRSVFTDAFAYYEQVRIPRTARVLYSAREMGRTQEQFYDALQWLYGWTAETCLD